MNGLPIKNNSPEEHILPDILDHSKMYTGYKGFSVSTYRCVYTLHVEICTIADHLFYIKSRVCMNYNSLETSNHQWNIFIYIFVQYYKK